MSVRATVDYTFSPWPNNPWPLFALLLCLALCNAPVSHAKGKYATLVDSLDALQQRAAVSAAPQGNDAPLAPVVIHATDPEPVTTPTTSKLEQIAEANAAPLTLDIRQRDQSVREDLTLFGYDIFSRVPSTFAPVDGIPVPENYLIGPGDNVVVQLFGNRNVEYNLVVTRDGDILIPEYGPVNIAGMSFDEAERTLTEGFERRVIGTRAVITMGKLRTIQIRLAGDVVQPGIYTVGGLSTFIDALLATGGIAPTGSLRNIDLIRHGKVIAKVDLYDLLLRGISSQDPYLEQNDTLFVHPIGNVAYIGGEVLRPAIYELNGRSSVGDLIDMAGGTLHSASLHHSHLERINARGQRMLMDFGNDAAIDAIRSRVLRNGDFVRILPLQDELTNAVLLSGHVRRPGAYQYSDGMTVGSLITNPDALMPNAEPDIALIRRQDPITLRTRVLYVPLQPLLTGSEAVTDPVLEPRDQVIVFDRVSERAKTLEDLVATLHREATAAQPAAVVQIMGHAKHTGEFPLANDSRLLDVLSLAGGARPGADLNYGVIVRTDHPGTRVSVENFSLLAAMRSPASDYNPKITGGDRLYLFHDDSERASLLAGEIQQLRQQARYGHREQTVTAVGALRFAGDYPLPKTMRVSDLLCAAGGLVENAHGLTGELTRIQHLEGSQTRARHISLDPVRLLNICYAFHRTNAGNLDRVAYRSLYLNDHVNPELRSRDQIAFRQKTGWIEQMSVSVTGEITRPGVYVIDRDETLCDVVARAGGPTPRAHLFGAVFTRQSVRTTQQQTLDGLKDQLDDLMVNLSLSHSFNNQSKSSHEWAGKQDYLRAIRQIESAEASGRMVIDLAGALECGSPADLTLENGDTLHIPTEAHYVHVDGQVYVPTSHRFSHDRDIGDYIDLSGGHTVLGALDHAYVIQANGEVLNLKRGRRSSRIKRSHVTPGSRIYVPLDVDRMNPTEKAQTWAQTLINSALIAGVIL